MIIKIKEKEFIIREKMIYKLLSAVYKPEYA
jgi:hypothetical protein